MNRNRKMLLEIFVFIALMALFHFSMRLLYSSPVVVLPAAEVLAYSVCSIQGFLGVECSVASNAVVFPGMKLIVTEMCLGIEQAGLLAVLYISFFGLRKKRNIKDFFALLLFVLVFNFLRLLLFYQFFLVFGRDVTLLVHDTGYFYLNGVLVVLLFLAYSYFRLGFFSSGKRAKAGQKPKRARKPS
ncbi:MAG TPA: hypothetical protein ENN46_03450 [Candidatus Woesearchaeota archaeon]|nr:hypothetical protein [Candidatus Woesearchaeota archaeon]